MNNVYCIKNNFNDEHTQVCVRGVQYGPSDILWDKAANASMKLPIY